MDEHAHDESSNLQYCTPDLGSRNFLPTPAPASITARAPNSPLEPILAAIFVSVINKLQGYTLKGSSSSFISTACARHATLAIKMTLCMHSSGSAQRTTTWLAPPRHAGASPCWTSDIVLPRNTSSMRIGSGMEALLQQD